MASIKDATEEAVSDKLAWLKHILYAIPIMASYMLFRQGDLQTFYIVCGITVILLLTMFSIVVNNVRNGNDTVLPTFNVLHFIVEMFKMIVANAPIFAICIALGIYLNTFQIPLPVANGQLIYSIIVWAILGSIMFTSLLQYAKTQNIKDAYNFKVISNSCIDILVAAIFFVPQILLVNGIFLGVITYVFNLFFGLDNLPYIFICCLAVSINVAITGNYFAQVDYEVIPHEEDAEKDRF